LSWEQEELSNIPFAVFRGAEAAINTIRFTKDQSQFLAASDDTNTTLWDVETGRALAYYGHNAPALKSVENNEDVILSVSLDKTLHLFDKHSGEEILEIDHDGLLTSCDYSNNSRYYAVTQDIKNEAIIYDARTDNKFDTIKLNSTPTCLEFSPNSQRIAIGTLQGEVVIWDIKARKFTLKFHEHSNAVSSICFDKDERMLVSGSWDKSIRMMDISTGNYRRKGTLREQFAIAHHGSVASVRIYSRGQHMVSGGFDKRVMLWNLDHEMSQIPLQGHQDWVNTVEGNIEGTRVLSGCRDGTIRYWNIENIGKIPLVQNNKKDAGVRTELCIECARPFPVATTNENLFTGKCVFCRIAERKVEERRKTGYDTKIISNKNVSTGATRRRTSFMPNINQENEHADDDEPVSFPNRRQTSFRPGML